MDLYNIPNDTRHPWRLNKFVEYQHEVPSIHYRTIGEYVFTEKLSKDDAIMLAWYCSVTYNEITAILLHEMIDIKTVKRKNIEGGWKEYKSILNFGSARKHAKNMDWFVPLIGSFMKLVRRQPLPWLESHKNGSPTETYSEIFKAVSSINFVGRFAADVFMECIVYMSDYLGLEIKEPFELPWKSMSNLTSGLLNIFYKDEEANLFDKTKQIVPSYKWLTKKLYRVQEAIEEQYPEQDNDITMFIGKVCSFRNLFKGTRYGGFHHDRQLGVLREYEKTLPEYEKTYKKIYSLRKTMFDRRFLGEFGGWDGIRKERTKLWLQEGLTGVETIS